MSSMRYLQLPSAPAGFGLRSFWTLARHRAITLDAWQPGYLRVVHGTVWATLDGPHVQGAANDWGDLVLRGGARIRLVPGQHVVLESYPDAANEEACFSWEPEAPLPAPYESWMARLWRSLRARGSALGHRMVRWLQRGPGWSRQSRDFPDWPHYPQDFHDGERDRAWRTLYHLGINQP